MFYLDRSFNLKQKKREFSQILTVDKNGNMTAKNLPVRRLWRVGYCHQEGEVGKAREQWTDLLPHLREREVRLMAYLQIFT